LSAIVPGRLGSGRPGISPARIVAGKPYDGAIVFNVLAV
jgi:hypothetical protein